VDRITLFADVLLPLPVSGTFTYRVPFELNDSVRTGGRVVVQFGQKRIYTAVVVRIHEKPPPSGIPKYILSVLDEIPLVTPLQMTFWEWMASYYLCYQGDVMNAALPAALKLASESRIALNQQVKPDTSRLNEKQLLLLEALHNRKTIAVSEVSRILDLKKTIPVIKSLIDQGFIISEEELNDPYKPRMEVYVRLTEEFSADEASLRQVFDELDRRAPRQLDILMTYVRLSQAVTGITAEVTRKELLKESRGNLVQLGNLVKKNILEQYERLVGRFDTPVLTTPPSSVVLSGRQEEAFCQIKASFATRDVILLHGVTSSGKTEIYIKLIDEVIGQGRQVLFMLPEIALTAQIINRLRKYFGHRVGVYHSRFNHHERVEIWNAVLRHGDPEADGPKYDIILGARSALFLPFTALGMVIVDEEHDSSFKQFDPAPRYNARDSAIYLAHLHGAKTLLGSATPSIETYYNASSGKYGLVDLPERYGNLELPLVRIIDLREALRTGKMKSHFSSALLDAINDALERREQVIIFQNRRGFSLRLECDLCHWMPACKNCDVTLVYHKKINQLRCHYCGYTAKIPVECPECRGHHIKMKGFGTEKVEEEIGLLFPGARISRMDLDTTRSRNSHQQIISDFEQGQVDILVGTQMVTKGLDFDRVSLVAILNADNLLNYPDFRSAERGFQLMSQVSGRSGRKEKQGQVIIQTFNPGHMIIRDVMNHDYTAMFRQQLAERLKFRYPPYFRLIILRLKHKDPEILGKAADQLAAVLRQCFGKRVLGPEYPMVSRIMNLHIKHIMLKIERDSQVAAMKTTLTGVISEFHRKQDYKSVRIILDVDPQ